MTIIKFPQRAKKVKQPKTVLPISRGDFDATVARMDRYLDGIKKAGDSLFNDRHGTAKNIDKIDLYSCMVMDETLYLTEKCDVNRGSRGAAL